MPIMGRERQLFEAICSILIQGHADFELVLQDGDPEHPVTDDVRISTLLNLVRARVKHVAEKDRGIFDAINRALKRATGDILYFMCSDDLLCPGALSAVNEVFESERFGGPYWLYGKTVSADVTGKKLGVDGERTSYEKLLEHNRLGQPAVFWNRQLMSLAGRFDPRYKHAADYDLWLRFWKYREPEWLDQELGVFRHHAEQNTNVHSKAVEVEAMKILQRHRMLSDVIMGARGAQVMREVYGADGVPESCN